MPTERPDRSQLIGATAVLASGYRALLGVGKNNRKPKAVADLDRRVLPQAVAELPWGHKAAARRASIAATTVAVESVVLRHLQAQVAALSTLDLAAVSVIESIYDDEVAYDDKAALESRAGLFWSRLLRSVVSWATEAVIWLGMRL